MVAGGVVVGVLGVHDGAAIAGNHRKALGVASGLVAISVRNVQLLIETREHGLRDHLTGCVNRAYGLEALDRELRLARRSLQPLSILMFDIDRFKAINDELGHLRGDDLLRAVGAQLTRVVRSTDVRCRYGGDEFLIVLPATPLAGAQHVAESIRTVDAIARDGGGRTGPIPVTVSIGVVIGQRRRAWHHRVDRAGGRGVIPGQTRGTGSHQHRRDSSQPSPAVWHPFRPAAGVPR